MISFFHPEPTLQTKTQESLGNNNPIANKTSYYSVISKYIFQT